MRRRKLRSYVIPMLILFLIFGVYITYAVIESNKRLSKVPDNHITETITRKELPVINELEVIINPYTQADVIVGKGFYDYKGSEEEQEKSITKYENTYLQNTGIDFTSDTPFEVVSILSGEVIDVKDDETLGKTVVIQQANNKPPVITKDGVSVAVEIQPKDEKVAIGSQLICSVARKALGA